jgi:hypothetical protein
MAGSLLFDSKREARRHTQLQLLQAAGAIRDLQRQVKFVLIPAQREPDTIGPKGGRKQGKLLERECAYIADFVYTDCETGETVVEDTKGVRTKDYVIKRKLMLYVHGIRIREV